MSRSTATAAGLAAGLVAISAQAASDTDPGSTRLTPLVVTPSRMAQTVDESLSSVTVIEREAIERQQPKQLQDLLQGRAGVSLSSNGAFGKSTSLNLRGTKAGHTLLLVDGMRLSSATLGQPAWQHLPPQQIERVEVVRGPRSSIYGADALGGVVQVFTRRGEPGEPRVNAFVGGGSLGTYEAGAGVSGGSEATRYSLSGGYLETDGIDVQDGVGDSADDGYDNSSVTGRVSHRLSPRVELFASGLYTEGETAFDADRMSGEPYDSAAQDYAQAATRAGARIDVTEGWRTELAYGHSRDEQETYYEGQLDGRTDTARDYLSWRNDLTLAPWAELSVGTDWREARVDSTTDYAETSRDNWGVYQLLTLDLARHQLEVSSRYDDNEAYGGHTTGQLAWGYALTERWQARVSYGTAFRAPTFNDLYYPRSGNPDLEPEESRSYEAGVRYTGSAGYVDVAAFRTDIDNLIEWAPTAAGMRQPQNVDEARITGVELESGGTLGPWQLKGAVTLMDHGNPDEPGSRLDRRPNASLRLDADRSWQDLELGATALARGRSFEGDKRLAGYGLLNLRAGYHLDRRWTVRAQLKNALDKDYETAAGYNQPGRAAYVSLHFNQR